MSRGGIAVAGLVKAFETRRAVDDLSFSSPPGQLTGFIGANGAGKTTTIRVLLGLISPTAGTATIGGQRYRDLANPRREVGVVLDTPGAHPGHRGRAHLGILARSAQIPAGRIDEVLELVELTADADRRVGAYSLGMRQRLSLAAALLGDPPVLILDEPTHGLDPAGNRWLRGLLRQLADEGRTLLVSSHHLMELEAVADRVVMIDQGRLMADAPIGELLGGREQRVLARSADDNALTVLLERAGGTVREAADGVAVTGLTAEQVGQIAAAAGIAVRHLDEQRAELEDLFFGLTGRNHEEAGDVVDARR
jgi:ABC-2 type transport system ATP-binding protein